MQVNSEGQTTNRNTDTLNTLIFDLGEVYLTGVLGVESKLEHVLGLSPKCILDGINKGQLRTYFEGRITEDEFWQSVINENQWVVDIPTLKRIVRTNFQEVQGVREILEELHRSELKLALLSVHAREWIDYCASRFDYHRLFNCVAYSFEIGLCKPDPRAYTYVLEKLGVLPENCLFVDDSDTNIVAARRLGMHVIKFSSASQLRAVLNDYGINV